jgi:hypothetical protein
VTAADLRRERVAFFAMLVDSEHPHELRHRDRGDRWSKDFARDPERLDSIAHRRVSQGRETFVGVIPRASAKYEHQCEYRPARALWADCDTARAVAKLAMFEPDPTAIVHSGGLDGDVPRAHAYWRLDAPLPAEDVRRHTLRLAHHLEADVKSTDAAHVLRIPGSLSFSSGRVARLRRFTGETHELANLTGGLADAPTWADTGSTRAKSTNELVELFVGQYTDGEGRHDHFRSIVGVLLRRCGDRLPPDVLLELAVAWAQAHTRPCKPRRELERNFDNLLARERKRRGLA